MAISLEVKSYIETYEAPIKKELSYIKDHNWVVEDSLEARTKMYERQILMSQRTMSKLEHFAKISENDRNYKLVERFIENIVEYLDIMFHRETECEELYDWFNYEEMFQDLEPEHVDKMIDEELAFQSKARDDISKLKIKLKKLNLDGKNTTLELPIRADIALPFLLRNQLEEMFPEIKRFINEKQSKNN